MKDDNFVYEPRILYVNLPTGKTWTRTIDAETARKFIGGYGLAAYLMFEEAPAGVTVFHPGNSVILMASPIGGTKAPGSGGYSANFIGPLTQTFCCTQAQGKWGARLRFAGWDGIVVRGVAPEWSYLVVDRQKIEIRPAEQLLGLNTWETERAIKEETGLSRASVAAIGPAGEHGVYFAVLENDEGHICATNGIGAVLGYKKIKGIAVHGEPGVRVADDEALINMRDSWVQEAIKSYEGTTTVAHKQGTLGSLYLNYQVGIIPALNYNVTDYEKAGYDNPMDYDGSVIRPEWDPERDPCWSCGHKHCHKLTVPSGPFKGSVVDEPEYEGMAAFSYLNGGHDPTTAICLSNLCDLLGMDVKECGFTIAVAMEAYAKGLITKEDTGGYEFTWGNYDTMHRILYDIANRRGIGDAMANGVKRFSEFIGGEAVDFGVYAKRGITPNVVNLRMYGAPALLNWVVMEASSGCGQGYPSDIHECISLCWNFMFCDMQIILDGVNACTGWDMTVDETKLISRRITTLMRAFNLIHGTTVDDDTISKRFLQKLSSGPAKDSPMPTIGQIKAMCKTYYANMGWDIDTSMPYVSTLRELGLDFVIEPLLSYFGMTLEEAEALEAKKKPVALQTAKAAEEAADQYAQEHFDEAMAEARAAEKEAIELYAKVKPITDAANEHFFKKKGLGRR